MAPFQNVDIKATILFANHSLANKALKEIPETKLHSLIWIATLNALKTKTPWLSRLVFLCYDQGRMSNNSPKDVQNPWVLSCAATGTLQVWLSHRSCDREIIQDYPVGCHKGPYKRNQEGQVEEKASWWWKQRLGWCGPSQYIRQPLEAGRAKEQILPGASWRNQPFQHLDPDSLKLISDFWTPEL